MYFCCSFYSVFPLSLPLSLLFFFLFLISMDVTEESPSRRSNASSSPEFEFWMLRNPQSSSPQPTFLSADELFADGFLVPLHVLSLTPATDHPFPPPPPPLPSQAEKAEDLLIPHPPPPSKKWRNIFKPGEKKLTDKKDRKPSTAPTAAELNIHIWPFSRSRSAGNGRPRTGLAAASRKTRSAPCSRSNSGNESSKSPTGVAGVAGSAAVAAVRKWAPNPGFARGIYLGRNNPVWQLRRRSGSGVVTNERKDSGGTGSGKGLNLNVNSCIGHQRPASCRDCSKDAEAVTCDLSGGGDGGSGDECAVGEVSGSLLNLRALFTKKVY